MAYDWFVIDRRSGRIINMVLTERADGPDLSKWLNAPHLYATREPTMEQRESYRYWDERP